MRRLRALLLGLLLLWTSPVWADGPQFNGTCTAIEWTQNTEPDLAWYRIYDRVSLTATPTLIKEVGVQVTSLPCSSFSFNAGQHYLSITAGDTSGNESPPSSEFAFVIVVTNQVNDLHVSVVNPTDMTLAFTEVDDGAGAPANYDIRMATPTINWGTSSTVSAGTCAGVVTGTTVGAAKTCTVTGLTNGLAYQYQLVPYRGSLGGGATFGPLSNIAGATAGGSVPPTDHVTQFTDAFTGADTADLPNWEGGYTGFSALALVSNAVRGSALSGNGNAERYTGQTLPANQWIQATVATYTAGLSGGGPACRMAAPPTATMYWADTNGTDHWRINRLLNGTNAVLATSSTTAASGQTVLLDCQDETLTITVNGTSAVSVSDAAIASGSVGLAPWVAGALSNTIWDNVAGGIYSAVTTDVCGCDNH